MELEVTSSPGTSPVNLSDCMEELVKFAVQSHIDGILLIDLGLSKEFCSYILNENLSHLTLPSTDSSSQELYQISLYKHLAFALYKLILSKTNISSCQKKNLFDKYGALKQNVEWVELVIDQGTELLNILKAINFELHVQEPFFKQLRDGQKTVEGRCAVGDYNRYIFNILKGLNSSDSPKKQMRVRKQTLFVDCFKMEAGALILFNKCLMLKVQEVRHYPSFSEMLKAETLGKVLPGVKTIEDGVRVYRKFYSEEKEMSNGVLAICVAKSVVQPYDILARILSGLGQKGIESILEFSPTTGTIASGSVT